MFSFLNPGDTTQASPRGLCCFKNGDTQYNASFPSLVLSLIQGVHWCHGTWKVMEKSWKMKQGHGNTWNVMENELGVMENNLGEGIKKF